MNASEKRIARNVIAFREDFGRRFGNKYGTATITSQWRLELARHSTVPSAQWSPSDAFIVRFAQRRIRETRVTYTCGYCGRTWKQDDSGVGRPPCPHCAEDQEDTADCRCMRTMCAGGTDCSA